MGIKGCIPVWASRHRGLERHLRVDITLEVEQGVS